MNAIATKPETPVLVDPHLLADSPYQKARVSDRGKVDELADSMRSVGVIEPLIARPRPHVEGELELVAGHRRKRAAIVAGLEVVPVLVREYSDDQVLEIQMVENSQREGVHPLDEADLFAELIKRGRTVAEIAAKVGRDASYVAKRLKLQQLTKACRDALDEDKLTLGAALELARVPAKVQDEALEQILNWHAPRGFDDGDEGQAAASVGGVRKLLERDFMLKLETAPFPTDDATLVKKAGACTTCPKRTGNQAVLFADVATDLCTDPLCFKAKGKAYWPIRAKAAEEAGLTVLDGAAAEKALAHYGSGFKKLDDEVYDLNTGKRKDVRALAAKAGLKVAIAQDPETGMAVELVREADIDKAMRSGREKEKASSPQTAFRNQQKREKAKRLKRERVSDLAIGQAVVAAEASKDRDAIEAVTVLGFVRTAGYAIQEAAAKRRGIAPEKKKHGVLDHEKALIDALEGMTTAQKRALGVELALHSFSPGGYVSQDPEWKTVLKAFGVSLDKIEAQVDAEEKAREAAAKAPKPGAKKKSAKSAPKAKAAKKGRRR